MADAQRIAQRLEQLWAIAHGPAGGADRPAYSEAEAEAMRLVAGWATEIGLEPAIDAAGNLWALPPGDAPVVTPPVAVTNGAAAPVASAHRPAAEPPGDFAARTRSYEARLLREAMEASRFNQRIAARMLGLTYYQLRHHLKVHGLLAKPSQGEDQPSEDQLAEARTVTGVET